MTAKTHDTAAAPVVLSGLQQSRKPPRFPFFVVHSVSRVYVADRTAKQPRNLVVTPSMSGSLVPELHVRQSVIFFVCGLPCTSRTMLYIITSVTGACFRSLSAMLVVLLSPNEFCRKGIRPVVNSRRHAPTCCLQSSRAIVFPGLQTTCAQLLCVFLTEPTSTSFYLCISLFHSGSHASLKTGGREALYSSPTYVSSLAATRRATTVFVPRRWPAKCVHRSRLYCEGLSVKPDLRLACLLLSR